MLTGFTTERTIEYMILNNLYTRIKDKYPLFYPFSYQRNRDDTQLSFKNKIEELHLITLFARRPKTHSPDSSCTAITFRPTLFEHVNFLSSLGITTIVGAPTGSNVTQICFGCTCCWFKLFPSHDENYFTCKFCNNMPVSTPDKHVSILCDNSLVELLDQAPKFSWVEVLSIAHEWNLNYKMTHPTAFFNIIPEQKPIFVVYK